MKTVSPIAQAEIVQQLLENQDRFARTFTEGAKPTPYPSQTWKAFRDRELARYMGRERGKKRLRKKKALRRMREVWALYLLTRPLSRFMNYQELGRKLFPIQPLPGGAKPIYDKRWQ